jgi:hypothetical protein
VESFRRLKFLVFDAKSLDGTENPAAALRTVDLTSFGDLSTNNGGIRGDTNE